MKTIYCAICVKKEKTKILYKENFDLKKLTSKTYSARRVPDRTHFRLVKCLKCGLIFSNPIIDKKIIYKLYKESNFTYGKESKYLAKTYFNYLQPYIKKMNSKKIRLLDIGCGNGFFLEEAFAQGIEQVYGVEPGRPSVLKANSNIRKNIKIDFFKEGLFKKNFFDVVCCFHTLDHIVDPNSFINNVRKILKKNGLIFFVVHNTNGLSVKIFGEKSPIFDIEHIYLFNETNLKKIFSKGGFKKPSVMNVANKYPITYWVHLFPVPIFIKKIVLKLLEFEGIGQVPIKISAGNIGIVAYK